MKGKLLHRLLSRMSKNELAEFMVSDDPAVQRLKITSAELHRKQTEAEVARTLRVVAGWHPVDVLTYRQQIIKLADDRDPEVRFRASTHARQSSIRGVRDDR